jgi:HK97 family phage prohead protease
MIVGYGAVFHRDGEAGTEYRLAPDIVERIAPTAFNRALQEKHDARGLFNHDPNMLLGRAAAGTLRMAADAKGLRYEIDLPDTQVGKDVAASIARGDLTGSSFSFRINGKEGQRFEKGKEFDVRHIMDVDLYDVGPVTFPAYEGTTTGMRSGDCDDAIEARKQWAAEREAEAVAVRSRIISLDNENAIA